MRTVRNDHKRSKWIHWINGCSGCPMITFICVWTATAARSSSSSSYRHTATPVRLFFFSFLLDAIDKLRSSQTPLSPNFTYLVLHRLHQNFSFFLKKKNKINKGQRCHLFLDKSFIQIFKWANEWRELLNLMTRPLATADPLASDSQNDGNVNKQSDPAHSTGTFSLSGADGVFRSIVTWFSRKTFSDDVPLSTLGGCSFVQTDEG